MLRLISKIGQLLLSSLMLSGGFVFINIGSEILNTIPAGSPSYPRIIALCLLILGGSLWTIAFACVIPAFGKTD